MDSDLPKIIISAAVGAFLKPAVEYLCDLTQFSFTWIKIRNISGYWKTVWTLEKSGNTEKIEDFIDLKQMGSFIRGTAKLAKYNYIVKGRVNRDGYVQGTWKDIQKSTDWYGSFKLKISTDGNKMTGKWIGKSEEGVRAGDWFWSIHPR